MAYVKHTWSNGEVITADKMNNIEGGILTPITFSQYNDTTIIGTSYTLIDDLTQTIPANSIYGISASLNWGNTPPKSIAIITDPDITGNFGYMAMAESMPNRNNGGISCNATGYTDAEITIKVIAESKVEGINFVSLKGWYIKL